MKFVYTILTIAAVALAAPSLMESVHRRDNGGDPSHLLSELAQVVACYDIALDKAGVTKAGAAVPTQPAGIDCDAIMSLAGKGGASSSGSGKPSATSTGSSSATTSGSASSGSTTASPSSGSSTGSSTGSSSGASTTGSSSSGSATGSASSTGSMSSTGSSSTPSATSSK